MRERIEGGRRGGGEAHGRRATAPARPTHAHDNSRAIGAGGGRDRSRARPRAAAAAAPASRRLRRRPPPFLSPGIPAADQRVLYAGRPLADESSLATLGVSDADTLHVLLRLLGGGKKRKKKTYTKPKKQKHKHKAVKLAVLKFFKVDDAGKIERLRQACPACGPATFMAKHFDRVYCGKCHVTYMVEGGAAGAKKGKAKK